MDISFGIITDGKSDERLTKVIESIKKLNIPNYEILIIGNSQISDSNIRIISFEEKSEFAWITKKRI